jgi:hypothetical protein
MNYIQAVLEAERWSRLFHRTYIVQSVGENIFFPKYLNVRRDFEV